MKCAVIILTFLHINNLGSGLDVSEKEDVAVTRGKRTVVYRKNSPLAPIQPTYDYNLFPKYYPMLNIQPYNNPEITMERRSNPLRAPEPPRVISTEQFETSKASVNLAPGYMPGNDYEVERYLPGDVLSILNELMKPLMMNNGRQIRVKKPGYSDGIYLRHNMNNVPEIPRHQIVGQSFSPVNIFNTEPPVITIKKEKKIKKNVTKNKLQTELNNPENEKSTNETTVSHITSNVTDSNTESSTTTIKYNDQNSTELESNTESTNTTINHNEEDKSDKDITDKNVQDVNSDDSDNDNESEEPTSTPTPANDTNHQEETVNDDLSVDSKPSGADDQKDDISIKSNQLIEVVKSEVAKQLELIIELLTLDKILKIDTTQEKSENMEEMTKDSKKNVTNVSRDKKNEKCCQNKEKAKSVFTNFEGNEHFANFFLFYPNRDIFNLKSIEEPIEKSNKFPNEKSKLTTEQKKGSIGTGDSNNKKIREESDKETDKLKVTVDKRNEKDDVSEQTEGGHVDPKVTNTESSLETGVSNSLEGDSSENEDTSVPTVETDEEENNSNDSNDGDSDLNESKIVKRSLLDVIR